MNIMIQLVEINNIDVLYFARKKGTKNSVDPREHSHNAQFKGNDCHALISRVNYFPHISNFDTNSDISKSEISFPPLDMSPISSPEPSPLNTSVLSLVFDLPPSNSFKIHSNSYLFDLEYNL